MAVECADIQIPYHGHRRLQIIKSKNQWSNGKGFHDGGAQ